MKTQGVRTFLYFEKKISICHAFFHYLQIRNRTCLFLAVLKLTHRNAQGKEN